MSAVTATRTVRREEGVFAFLPTLTPRVRFATKTALAITLSYLGAMAMNWSQPYQGPIAIMVIASAGPLRESLGKGVMRVVGTVAGAALGLLFLALFPQDQTLYFLALTLTGGVIVYLYHAWQGDKSFWLIMLMVMVLLYNYGYVDDRLIYALDRSWSTAFGIFVYAMINLYLWPEKEMESRVARVRELARSWRESFGVLMQKGAEEADATLGPLRRAEEALERSLRVGTTEYPGGIAFDRHRWSALWGGIVETDRHLERLALMEWGRYRERVEQLLPESRQLCREIGEMMAAFEAFWNDPKSPRIPPERGLHFTPGSLEGYAAVDRAQILSLAEEIEALHRTLRDLLKRLATIVSPEPDPIDFGTRHRTPQRFHWGDPHDLKAALVGMLVFWAGLGFWYLMPNDLGYMVPAMAFAMGLIVLFTPLNPMALILIYSLSFLVSFLTFVFVLPMLHTWWELGLYFFVYMFAAYYFIPATLSLFFGLGLVFQYIYNTTYFSFQLFMTILLIFYLFLGLLLIFNYLPFSNRPEDLFRQVERRFRRLSRALADAGIGGRGIGLWRRWALAQLPVTAAKMKLWAAKLDRSYFDRIDDAALNRYLEAAQRSAEILLLLEPLRRRLRHGAFLAGLRVDGIQGKFSLTRLLEGNPEEAGRRLEERMKALDDLVRSVDWKRINREELIDLARYVTLRKRLEQSLIEAETSRREAGLEQLKWSRF